MRFAYSGRLRSNQQPAYGHIEARTSGEAIDLLADQGIIGVMTVRPEPLPAVPPAPRAEFGNKPTDHTAANVAAELRQTISQVTQMLHRTEALLRQPQLRIVDKADWKSDDTRTVHPAKTSGN